ncbi:Molybdenum cofactor sulfurase [Mycena sanguinolenta]|uniref:Molybdenum cofactor sulfurase n=1 Tax=Mycena sanguinolenta TaxID=230812 RepID=A0A8H7DIP5_9AGAR|nr:Molybdenum cofactor sulfurase [Mycena sanguinolenta]
MGKPPTGSQPHIIVRKRSAIRPRLPCTSGASIDLDLDLDRSLDSLVNEKFRYIEPPRENPPPLPSFAVYALTKDTVSDAASGAYQEFLSSFPEYRLTWILDSLRRSDYGRLETTGETYVDYMGGSIYPESLIRAHTEFLNRSVLGNTHSVNNSSKLSLKCADEARAAVLSFFRAPSDKYTVIFTANATGALKLVGESYPFAEGSSYVLSCDSHNSVNGIREYAAYRGAHVCYIPPTSTGGFEPSLAKDLLLRNRPRSKKSAPCLFALTGQSNISNTKNSLSITEYATSLGYHTVLDGAALAPTSSISLSEFPVDAMAVSFYKLFGFPTGVGALIVKKSFLEQLKRPWFAGGNVEIVQVPGTVVIRSHELHEQFEDGTINYLTLPAVTEGLRFLSAYLPFLPLRLSCLMHYLVASLSKIRHERGTPVVRILSATPSKRLRCVGEQSDTGSTISMIFLDPSGEPISNSFIEYSASKLNISLRTGCVCNPGGAAAMLGIEEDMKHFQDGLSRIDLERAMGKEIGVVRISLGLASNFQDAWTVVRFTQLIAVEKTRNLLWEHYRMNDSEIQIGQAI